MKLNTLILLLCIYSLVMYVVLNISLYKILVKEQKNAYMAFIPFYNFYLYFNYCRLPFWTFFIPFLNVFVIFLSPYNLCKNFRCKNYLCVIAVIFPFILLPYVAFSNLKHKDYTIKKKFLNNLSDVDALENSLVADADNDFIVNDSNNTATIGNEESAVDRLVNSIENIEFQDDIYYNDPEFDTVSSQPVDILKPEDNIIEDTIPILDEHIESLSTDETKNKEFVMNKETINVTNIDSVETNIINAANNEINIETNYKDFEEVKPTEEAIAFGGAEMSENYIQAKVDELKCTRCGSSLIGAKEICPGCGMKI